MGNWVLGLAGTNEQCQMQNYYPYFCYTIGQGKAITIPALKACITAIPRQTPFLIRADKDIPLQGFVEVLDLLKTAGFRKVSLQTEWMGR